MKKTTTGECRWSASTTDSKRSFQRHQLISQSYSGLQQRTPRRDRHRGQWLGNNCSRCRHHGQWCRVRHSRSRSDFLDTWGRCRVDDSWCWSDVLDNGSKLDEPHHHRRRCDLTYTGTARQGEVAPTPPLPTSPHAPLAEREQLHNSRKSGYPGTVKISGFSTIY